MSWVNLHALTLLSLPIAAFAVSRLSPRRSPSRRQEMIATVVAGGSAFMVYALNSHLCFAGNPSSQCIIAGVSIWVVLAYTNQRWVRRGVSIAMIGAMVWLSVHYGDLVHDAKWTGNVQRLAVQAIKAESQLADVRDTAMQVSTSDESVYKEGWLRELPVDAILKDEIGDDRPYRAESQRLWHSWFTGLFQVDRVTQDYWYPGGLLSDRASKIALKDTP
jgi:hypothetical protein